ncbi:beta-lactamase [Hyphomonas neptunium ATCC 15444]|uniref:Beta-lactamase n=2 Tax=Hyphomonas TaxID=85 RepID=Q0C552_HYPNA|nr:MULTISPECIES: serine hydrolase domain-containing protein [Hyphomonas]ABI78289.1 beta-lactamase [Hyphomonas neptunium ATCC 15444]KCZ95574.1 beta-lactamase [Hyphomonas hirschiana VP5]
MTRIFALLLGFFSLTAPAIAQGIDYERLDQRLTQLSREDDMVGLAVAVIEGGEITFARGYGVTAEGEGPVTRDTVFRWASLSKGVATSLVTKLAMEGRFSLSDTLSSFKTSLRLPGGGEQTATLEDLMAHKVGVVSNAYDTMLEDGADPAEIRRRLGTLKVVCPIRECHSYQNVAFDALSEIVEQTTGLTYAAAAEIILFRPLRMSTASTGRAALMSSASWAKPYTARRGTALPIQQTVKEPYYRVPAAGGVNGSILDLAQFARAQMGLAPDILTPDTLTVLHTPRVYTPREQSRLRNQFESRMQDSRYALGWRVYKYDITGNRVVGHRGAVEGYRSLMLFDPELDTGVVALWNSSARRPVGIELEVMDMAYGLPPHDWMKIDGGSAGAAN